MQYEKPALEFVSVRNESPRPTPAGALVSGFPVLDAAFPVRKPLMALWIWIRNVIRK